MNLEKILGCSNCLGICYVPLLKWALILNGIMESRSHRGWGLGVTVGGKVGIVTIMCRRARMTIEIV